ncbi:MAG: molybdenum transporter [Deltaproteobacteria bacterium]|nr:MAG: molybdenum transporter [Deltaproteobacteria bacterium]
MKDHRTKDFRIRTKTWIENEQKELLFGKGKTEILTHIELEGSISRAAEKMGLNYKKAWTHIKILQQNIEDEMVVPQKGGRGTGGTKLTPKAKEMIEKYQQLQREIEEFADQRFQELFFDG